MTVCNDTRSPAPKKQPGISFVRMLALFGSLACVHLAAFAQSKPVFITSSFVDKNGFFIENLSPDEIQIFENDQPRKLEFLAKDEIPGAYGLIFDKAVFPEYSERGRLSEGDRSSSDSARSISYGLIDKMLGRQTVFVAAYDSGYQVTLDFALDAYRAKNAIQHIAGTKQPHDSFLYQALLSGIKAMNQRPERRRVIILFVQSVDVNTSAKIKPLKNLVDASNLELFTISFGTKTANTTGRLQLSMSEAVLKDLVKDTAGEFLPMSQYRDHPEDIVRRLYNIFRTFYTVGFQSDSQSGQPGRLTIKCTRPGSKVKHRSSVPLLG